MQKFLTYIKTKTVMKQSQWIHISDKQIEADLLKYSDGYNRHETIEQLRMEGVIDKRKETAPGRRPYNVYRLMPDYWDMVEVDIKLIKPPKQLAPMHQKMTEHLGWVSIDIDSYADVLTPDYLAYFKLFLSFRQSEYLSRFVTVCEFAHRFHTPITNLKREVRPHLTMDNKPTTGLDVATMQPTILAAILDKYVPGNSFSKAVYGGQDVYVYLQEKAAKKTRDEGKKLFFELAFAPASDSLAQHFGQADWVDWINRVKRANNPKNPHNNNKRYSNMAWLLQTNEVRIMQEVWERHLAVGIPFLTVHDEIIVPETFAVHSEKLIRSVLDKEFKCYKLNCKV